MRWLDGITDLMEMSLSENKTSSKRAKPNKMREICSSRSEDWIGREAGNWAVQIRGWPLELRTRKVTP